MLRGKASKILGMKLRRMLDREETEPKVAQDRACIWKSSTEGKSTYTSRLCFFEEKKLV